jgi:hypothetical protein
MVKGWAAVHALVIAASMPTRSSACTCRSNSSVDASSAASGSPCTVNISGDHHQAARCTS